MPVADDIGCCWAGHGADLDNEIASGMKLDQCGTKNFNILELSYTPTFPLIYLVRQTARGRRDAAAPRNSSITTFIDIDDRACRRGRRNSALSPSLPVREVARTTVV